MKTEELYKLFLTCGTVSTDTRKDLRKTLFFALKGENFDANDYALDAIGKGASYAVVDKKDLPDDPRLIKVDDTLSALQSLAAYHRQQLKIPVICIAGSNGKTTTKELVSGVLSTQYSTYSTPGNFNNHIGVPLSLLQLNKKHEMAVIEIGANHPGENKLLVNLVRPTHGIITNIGKDHMGEFGSRQGIVDSYSEFIDYFNMEPDAVLFYNADDKRVTNLVRTNNKRSFGKYKNADFSFSVSADSLTLSCKLFKKQVEAFEVKSKLFGSFNAYNLVTAFAAGEYFGVDNATVRQALEDYSPENMRSQVLQWHGNTLVLDAYNANPSSMAPALADFHRINKEGKIVILGDMFELGKYSTEEHRAILDFLENKDFEQVILAGHEFGKFKTMYPFHFFENANAVKNWILSMNFADKTFFVKGSRGMKLEKIFT